MTAPAAWPGLQARMRMHASLKIAVSYLFIVTLDVIIRIIFGKSHEHDAQYLAKQLEVYKCLKLQKCCIWTTIQTLIFLALVIKYPNKICQELWASAWPKIVLQYLPTKMDNFFSHGIVISRRKPCKKDLENKAAKLILKWKKKRGEKISVKKYTGKYCWNV